MRSVETESRKSGKSPFDPALIEEVKTAKLLYNGEGSPRHFLSLVSEWKRSVLQEKPHADLMWRLIGQLAEEAIRSGHSDFFEQLARAVDQAPYPCPLGSWEDDVFLAFDILSQRGVEFAKKDVQRLAERLRAATEMAKQGEEPKEWSFAEYVFGAASEDDPAREEVEKAYTRRIKRFRVDWTKLFKRCGLADLQSNPGGRPPGRKNYLP
jgi:hypothetical protein